MKLPEEIVRAYGYKETLPDGLCEAIVRDCAKTASENPFDPDEAILERYGQTRNLQIKRIIGEGNHGPYAPR